MFFIINTMFFRIKTLALKIERSKVRSPGKTLDITFLSIFTNLTKSLKSKKISPALKKKSLKHLLRLFKNYSTKKIREHLNSKEIFTFREFQETEVLKTIKELPKNKASTFKDMPVKIIINSVHIYSKVLTNIFNDCVKSGKFPDVLKYADITPVFKIGDTTDKTNYRPISTLSNFSKDFEKMIYIQINSFMEQVNI